MRDTVWAEDLEEGEELPSEEFWRTLEEGDPERQAASKRLTGEIATLRLVLRQLFKLAMETEEVNALVHYTDLYGRGCMRLLNLLKAEKGTVSRAAEKLMEMRDQAIAEVCAEFGLDLPS
jgi:hypothetical protein